MIRRQGPVYAPMNDYGGGSYSPEPTTRPKRHFYLIVNGAEPTTAVDGQAVDSFFRAGVNSQSDYIFVFVDIASDHRLRNDLAKTEAGTALYERIASNSPAFLVCEGPIQKVTDLAGVLVSPIADYDTDVTLLYRQMGFDKPASRRAAISFLKRINRYLHLKPSIMGLGANLNEMIADLLARMERDSI